MRIDRKGNAEAPRPVNSSRDKERASRADRRAGKIAMKRYVQDLNTGGHDRAASRESNLEVSRTMLSLVEDKGVEKALTSRPLFGLSNYELRKICSAIVSATNIIQKKHS